MVFKSEWWLKMSKNQSLRLFSMYQTDKDFLETSKQHYKGRGLNIVNEHLILQTKYRDIKMQVGMILIVGWLVGIIIGVIIGGISE